MELFILGHILGDFYLQTEKLADKKKNNIFYMMLYCALYAIVMGSVILFQTGDWGAGIGGMLILAIAHGVVDICKTEVEKKCKPKWNCIIFLFDQCIHVVILWIAYACLEDSLIRNIEIFEDTGIVIMVIISSLICWKPAAIFISLIMKALPETVERNDEQGQMLKETGDLGEVAGAGFLIGILEREIILLLGLLGQYSAIGFVLTAKSVARYKQLEKQGFAEKYLIGTLASALIAMLCVAVCFCLTNE